MEIITMLVASYLNTIPSLKTNKHSEKALILKNYFKGVRATKTDAVLHKGFDIVKEADVAVIQGWVHNKHNSPHLNLRKQIIDFYTRNNKKVVSADANLFLYANPSNTPHHYLRYSFNGIFPNTGIYCDDVLDKSRWNKISKNLNIKLDPMIKQGNHILLCCQRDGGWSMGTMGIIDWIEKTCTQIRRVSDRPIVLRAHPGDKNAKQYLTMNNKRIRRLNNITVSDASRPIEHDLRNAWAVVNHNSSSIVGPIIYGYHSFITDAAKSQCAEVSHTDFQLLENPQEFDRQQWLERISMFHWSFDELISGECWSHMRNYV